MSTELGITKAMARSRLQLQDTAYVPPPHVPLVPKPLKKEPLNESRAETGVQPYRSSLPPSPQEVGETEEIYGW